MGSVIPAFGAFVVGGNLVVGLIVFAIVVTIQFIVIASGSGRVAEVAARFTLDAMPGKQMAIDADVHAGVLDPEGARRKRALVQAEADFYGAMDGAGKFVKGDAIASLVIVGINLAGGVAVGMIYHGLSAPEALSTFALLTVGNALLTTLPAFLLSTAMGMMVTRVAASGSLGSDLTRQIFERPYALRAGGALMLGLAFVPGLPRLTFGGIGLLALAASVALDRRAREDARLHEEGRRRDRERAMRQPETAFNLVGVDALSIAFGADLLALMAPENGDRLLSRIGEVRRALAAEIGIVIPGVRLRDDVTLETDTYALYVREVEAARGSLRLDRVIAVADEAILATFEGDAVREPVYGLAARWIVADRRAMAIAAGALVFDPISMLGSHLAEIVRLHAAHLLSRQEMQTMLEYLRGRAPALVKDVTEAVPTALLHAVFVALLRERAWPRDVTLTIEAIVDAAAQTREVRALVEAARRAIVPAQLRREGRLALTPLVVAPDMERHLAAAWVDGALAPEPALAAYVRSCVERYLEVTSPAQAAIVCGSAVRGAIAEFLFKTGLRVDVYAFAELPRECVITPSSLLEAQAGQSPVMVNA